MALKSSRREEQKSALRELLGRGEEVVNVFLEELTGSASLREELEKTADRANRARQTVDRNMEAVLGALNVPTRSDYERLLREIHALQGSIVNLNMKIDRLLAARDDPSAASPAPGAAAVPGAPKPVRRTRKKTRGRTKRQSAARKRSSAAGAS